MRLPAPLQAKLLGVSMAEMQAAAVANPRLVSSNAEAMAKRLQALQVGPALLHGGPLSVGLLASNMLGHDQHVHASSCCHVLTAGLLQALNALDVRVERC